MQIDFSSRSIEFSVLYAAPPALALGTTIGLLSACPAAAEILHPHPPCIRLPRLAHFPGLGLPGSPLLPFSINWLCWNPEYPASIRQLLERSGGFPDLLVLGDGDGLGPAPDPSSWIAETWRGLTPPILRQRDGAVGGGGLTVATRVDAGDGLVDLGLAAARSLAETALQRERPNQSLAPVELIPGAMATPEVHAIISRTRNLLLGVLNIHERMDLGLRRRSEALERRLAASAAHAKVLEDRSVRAAKILQALIEHTARLSARCGESMPEISIPLDDTVPDPCPVEASETWRCASCETTNPIRDRNCSVCGATRPAVPSR